eukprot:10194864-Alexandrium_andersonii.AAC.1
MSTDVTVAEPHTRAIPPPFLSFTNMAVSPCTNSLHVADTSLQVLAPLASVASTSSSTMMHFRQSS